MLGSALRFPAQGRASGSSGSRPARRNSVKSCDKRRFSQDRNIDPSRDSPLPLGRLSTGRSHSGRGLPMNCCEQEPWELHIQATSGLIPEDHLLDSYLRIVVGDQCVATSDTRTSSAVEPSVYRLSERSHESSKKH
jgi:hypothetical protein